MNIEPDFDRQSPPRKRDVAFKMDAPEGFVFTWIPSEDPYTVPGLDIPAPF